MFQQQKYGYGVFVMRECAYRNCQESVLRPSSAYCCDACARYDARETFRCQAPCSTVNVYLPVKSFFKARQGEWYTLRGVFEELLAMKQVDRFDRYRVADAVVRFYKRGLLNRKQEDTGYAHKYSYNGVEWI